MNTVLNSGGEGMPPMVFHLSGTDDIRQSCLIQVINLNWYFILPYLMSTEYMVSYRKTFFKGWGNAEPTFLINFWLIHLEIKLYPQFDNLLSW